jgi:hypothetical protein
MSSSEGSPKIAPVGDAPRASIWIRELPYVVVLILTILGVAYTSYLKQPIAGYWELLAPFIGLTCVGAGWRYAGDREARFRLIWMQALHWLAFLVVMNLLFLPSVQQIFAAGATGLAILSLLALGTFTAGVQVRSWQVCGLGLIMALGVPATAWIERSSLIVVLITAMLLGVAALVWWHRHGRSGSRNQS